MLIMILGNSVGSIFIAIFNNKIKENKEELFNLRFQAEVGKLENTAQLKKVKKEIARCYTVLTERENTK